MDTRTLEELKKKRMALCAVQMGSNMGVNIFDLHLVWHGFWLWPWPGLAWFFLGFGEINLLLNNRTVHFFVWLGLKIILCVRFRENQIK